MSRYLLNHGWWILAGLLVFTGLGALALSHSMPLTCANHPLQSCPSDGFRD